MREKSGVFITVTVECLDCGVRRVAQNGVKFKTEAEAIEAITKAGWKNAAYFGLKRVEENFYLCLSCSAERRAEGKASR